jgi:metal transporter CNNM
VWILWKKFLVVFFKDVNLNGAAGIIAVVASTVLLVIFSEIIPQAVCSRHGLAIGAFFAWPVRILICVLFIVAWPIAKVLDMLLGSQHGVLYRSAELKELIAMHATTQEKGGDLQTDAVTILQGALDLQTKSVRHAMTPLNQTFMLSINTILDRKTMAKILRSGHSRIPIFDGPADQTLADRNITGVLLVKSLILLDPDDNTPLKDVKLGSMPQVDPKMSLFELLNVFQEGGSKLAKTYFQKSARQLLIATYIGHMATVFESDEADSTISDGSNSSIVPSSKKKHRFRRASGSSTSSSSSSESHHFFSRLRRGRKSDIEKGGDTDSQPRDDHAIEIKTEPDEQDKMSKTNDTDGKTYSTTATPSVKVPAVNRVIGIITLEDVLEELIQEEIYDETDVRKLASLTAMRAETANGERVILASHKIAPTGLAQVPVGGKRGVWKKRRRLSFESNRSLDESEQRKEILRREKELEESEERNDSIGDLLPNSPGGSDTTGSRHRLVARSMTDPTGFEMLPHGDDNKN